MMGLIQVYTGDGKGKTTAALGLAIRALGQEKKVGIIFFDKGGEHYSERKVLLERFPEIDFIATGIDRRESSQFRFGAQPNDKREAQRGLQIAKEWVSAGKHDLVILDEINTTVSLRMLELEPVLDLLRERSKNVEIICTGRNAPPEICELADLITEMKAIKHYFYQGVPARPGLDY